ncbi:hypothetical protein [Streptomyces europaeiscabiei]|uniref:hypothetical protein n=1 Tax=Streptomyces europaeiscabiei TaxID=146819 RepID=UPI0007658B2F|nr:hypothetical protein [Streptomyces europaeiscabiei]MDX3831378.1 hypothetical protein [Streptomyces europaeiscabiei]
MSQQYPQQQPGWVPPQPPKKMSTGAKVALGCGIPTVLGLLFLGGCAVLVGGVAEEVDEGIKRDQKSSEAENKRAGEEDVKITACSIGDDGFGGQELKVKLQVTNNGKDRASYLVEGEVTDQDGNQITTINAFAKDLNHGKSKTENNAAFATGEDLKDATKITCKILNVDRTAVL